MAHGLAGVACTVCDLSEVIEIDGLGEHVRKPALQVSAKNGTLKCLNCQTRWGPEDLLEFAKDLLRAGQ